MSLNLSYAYCYDFTLQVSIIVHQHIKSATLACWSVRENEGRFVSVQTEQQCLQNQRHKDIWPKRAVCG
jgi:hypothetical protein